MYNVNIIYHHYVLRCESIAKTELKNHYSFFHLDLIAGKLFVTQMRWKSVNIQFLNVYALLSDWGRFIILI